MMRSSHGLGPLRARDCVINPKSHPRDCVKSPDGIQHTFRPEGTLCAIRHFHTISAADGTQILNGLAALG